MTNRKSSIDLGALGLVEMDKTEQKDANGGSWLSFGIGAAFGLALACTTLNPIAGWAAGTVLAAELEAVGA